MLEDGISERKVPARSPPRGPLGLWGRSLEGRGRGAGRLVSVLGEFVSQIPGHHHLFFICPWHPVRKYINSGVSVQFSSCRPLSGQKTFP